MHKRGHWVLPLYYLFKFEVLKHLERKQMAGFMGKAFTGKKTF